MKPLIEAMRNMHSRIAVYGEARTPEEMAALAQESTRQHLQNMEQVLPLLTTALFSQAAQGQKLFRDYLEPMIRERGRVLEPLVRNGIDPEFVGLANFGMMFAVAMQRWLGTAGETDLGEIARQFNLLSTGGFARRADARNSAGKEDQTDET